MADNKEYMTHQESMGTIQISEDVVASIATSACLEVEGVGGLMNANVTDYVTGKKMTAKGIRVEMDGEGIVVNLFILLRYGCAVSEVAQKVQSSVFAALEGMTGFPVKASNPPVQCPAVVLMTRMASASKSGFTPLSTFISVSSPSFVIVKLRVTLPCIPAFFSILGYFKWLSTQMFIFFKLMSPSNIGLLSFL